MKLISIFYFINVRLVIALNSGFGALKVAVTGIQIREFPRILSRGQGKDWLPSHAWRMKFRKGQTNSQTLELNLSSTDSVNNSEVLCLLLFFLNQRRKDKGFD